MSRPLEHRVSRGCSDLPWAGQTPKAAGWDKHPALFFQPHLCICYARSKGCKWNSWQWTIHKTPSPDHSNWLMARLHRQCTAKQYCSEKLIFDFLQIFVFHDHSWPYVISFLLLLTSIWNLIESFASVVWDLAHFYSVSALGTYANTAMTLPHVYKPYAACLFIIIRT